MTNKEIIDQLAPSAQTAAKLLLEKFPDLVLTSGRRNLYAQAQAMATNTIQDGELWISNTYKDSVAIQKLQQAVIDHSSRPRGFDVPYLTGILSAILAQMPIEEQNSVSRHLTGLAFDIEPITEEPLATEVKEFIKALPKLNKFLEREGNLSRFHLQFNE